MNVRPQIGVKAESLLQKPNGSDPECMDVSNAQEEQPKVHYNPPHTYTCYGLPYQDHNYVAPPPPTPPASPPPQPTIKVNGHIDIENVSNNTEVRTSLLPDEPIYTPDDSITRCVCDFEHDDGYMICCDKCSVWQHIVCMGIDRNSIPDKYLCEKCEPREVDKPKAREIQIKKREELAKILYAIDSSTETEDETIRLGINPGRDRLKKSKGKKKKEREKVTKANAKKAKKLKKDKKLKEKATPLQKNRKRPKLLTTSPGQSQPGSTPDGPTAPKKDPDDSNPGSTPPKLQGSDTSPTSLTASTTSTKRPIRRNSLKSPKSPIKTGVKSPIAKALGAKSPLRSPKSPIKSPVKSPIKTSLKSPVKSPIRTAPKSPAKSPQGKPISSLNLNENALDSWDSHLPEGYEVAKSNQYTQDIVQILATKKLNGQHPDSGESKPGLQLLAQLCRVAQVNKNCKGLEATEDLKSDLAIIEYTGKVMLREQYDKENIFFRRLQPFVLFYSDFENLDLCVNAESYGNDARYIRRSCTPNAKVLHMVQNGNVLFFIYSQRNISKGAEITIPFDFDYQESNYDVECACSRPSCPVVKFYQRKEESKQSKKKRSARLSQREKRSSISGDPSAEESNSNVSVGTNKANTCLQTVTSPPLPSPTHTPTPTPTTTSTSTALSDTNKSAAPPLKRRRLASMTVEPVSKIKDESRELRRKSTTNKDDDRMEEVKSIPLTPLSPGSNAVESEDESAAAERRKKMTREERKMEAIMKAFEKLEKREERRKEALARLEHAKKPERPEKETREGKDTCSKSAPEKEDTAEETEKCVLPAADSIPKLKMKKKSKHAMAQRRGSRVNSSASGYSSTADPPSSADESSNQLAPQTPASAPPSLCDTSQNLNTPSTPSGGLQGKAFRFPKTKKHMMNEWLSEKAQDLQKPLTIKTDALEVNVASETPERSTEFVKCVPSPHATPLSHLRRSSFSGTHTQKNFNTPSPVQLDCNLGSAKKRWLRQAMFESTTGQPGAQQSPSGSMSPVPNGGMSPNPNSSTNSPGASPQVAHNLADFVTPLKKRRLARESISMETPPYPPTPSTPTPVMADIQIQDMAREDPATYNSLKVEEGENRGLNGFRTHFSSTVQGLTNSPLFEGLGEEKAAYPSTSELLLTPSCSSLTRERHESGRSDYRSEVDTDTEDSRPEDILRSRLGSDSMKPTRGLEMLTQLAIQAERQRQEDSHNFTSTVPSVEKTLPEPGYKIELKPEVPLVQAASSFPSLGLIGHPSKPKTLDSFKVEPGSCVDEEQADKQSLHRLSQSEGSVSHVALKQEASVKVESPDKYGDEASVEQASPGRSPGRPTTTPAMDNIVDDKTSKELNSSSEMDTSFEEGQGACHNPDFGCEPVNMNETSPKLALSQGGDNEETTSGSHPLLASSQDHCKEVLCDDSNRSQCTDEQVELGVPECDRGLSKPVIQEEDIKRGEVESSTSEQEVQRYCSAGVSDDWHPVSHSSDSILTSPIDSSEASPAKETKCAESTVTSHSDNLTNVLIPMASSSSTMPTQSDALTASLQCEDNVNNRQIPDDYSSQDQCPMSSNGAVGKSGEGEVSSLVEEGPVMSQSGNNEQVSLESVTVGDSADSSNKGGAESRGIQPCTHQAEERDSVVETLVSCSSDAPVCTLTQEAEASTSTAGVTADNYELEEGECIGDTEEEEEVTSMEASVGSDLQPVGAEVSSSKEDRMEENMEVDLPDQSSDGEPVYGNQCHVVSTGKQASSRALPDTATASSRALPDTATASSRALPDTATASSRALPDTATASSRALPDTATASSRALPDTATASSRALPDTATASSRALPDTATPLHNNSDSDASTRQEPHSATTTESPPSHTHSASSRFNEEAIDSTSGVVDSDLPVPSQSKLSESAVGDVSSSSATPQNVCESMRSMSVEQKAEEPSPSTSNFGNGAYFSSRDNSVSPSDGEAQSATVTTQGGNSLLSHSAAAMERQLYELPMTSGSANGSISSSSSSPVLPSAGLSTNLHSTSSSSSSSSSSCPSFTVSTSPCISPTGTAPSSSTSLIPTLQPTPTKKRVSLLEYRKRMKQKGRDVAPAHPSSSSSSSSASSTSSSSSSSATSPSPVISSSNKRDPRTYNQAPAREQNDSPPTLAPLPLFETYPGARERQHQQGGRPLSEDDEADSRWNTAATSVERIREQTLSITERLRREFGVDAADESSEDDERSKERRRLTATGCGLGTSNTSSSPPPPPPPSIAPPPPPPGTHNGGEGSSSIYGGPPHIGGPPPHQRGMPPPAPLPSIMGAPPPPPPPQKGQQQQQQQSSSNNMSSLMAIPSYTTKHYREKRSGGSSSNFSYPAAPHPHGSQYAPTAQTSSQFNNITITPTPPPQQYQRSGNKAHFSNKHHQAAPHHGHQAPPPPPPPPPSSSTPQPPPPPPSSNQHQAGAYAAAYTAVPTPSLPQFNSGVLLPPPPPRYNQGFPQQPAHTPPPPPPPHGKIIRDYHHKH